MLALDNMRLLLVKSNLSIMEKCLWWQTLRVILINIKPVVIPGEKQKPEDWVSHDVISVVVPRNGHSLDSVALK